MQLVMAVVAVTVMVMVALMVMVVVAVMVVVTMVMVMTMVMRLTSYSAKLAARKNCPAKQQRSLSLSLCRCGVGSLFGATPRVPRTQCKGTSLDV